MRHLAFGDDPWCDADLIDHLVNDPRDCDCAPCLRKAAGYGALAAMRGAAVEAGAHRDPELVQERDEAVQRLDNLRAELAKRDLFPCHGCNAVMPTHCAVTTIGNTRWCFRCGGQE